MSNKQTLQAWVETLSEEEARRTLEMIHRARSSEATVPPEEIVPQDEFERRLSRLTRMIPASVPPLPEEAVRRDAFYD